MAFVSAKYSAEQNDRHIGYIFDRKFRLDAALAAQILTHASDFRSAFKTVNYDSTDGF